MAKGTLTSRPRPAPEPQPVAAPQTNGSKPVNLQDQFLNHLRREKTPVTMFLVKGVKLQGIVEAGAPFIEKPFTPDLLARRVREALDN